MKAVARIVAEEDGRGGTRLVRLRSEPPVLLRATPGGVYLVSGAGGPLGGDDVTVEVDVGPGAQLTVRSAATAVALPGPAAAPSRLRVRARIGAGGALWWMPEPVVAACGCDHRMDATVSVGRGGRLVWWEELVLGRHGEAPGSVTSRLHADVDARPLLRHELELGPRSSQFDGPAVVGPARAVGSVLVVDPAWESAGPSPVPGTPTGGAALGVLVLDGPGVQVVALAADAMALRRALESGICEVGHPYGPGLRNEEPTWHRGPPAASSSLSPL